MQLRGAPVTLKAGEGFYEGPNDVHIVGRNASDSKPGEVRRVSGEKARCSGTASRQVTQVGVSCSNSRISHTRLRRKRNRLFIAPVGVIFMGEVIAVVWAD